MKFSDIKKLTPIIDTLHTEEEIVNEVKLLCSDCSCEELLQPCEACDNYFAQKNHRKK